jgi:hypothetical protein
MNCEPSERDELRAYWTGDHVLLVAVGSYVESCWSPRLERSVLTVWPPEFVLSKCRTADICLPVVTPFVISEAFPLGTRPEAVVVDHADGKDEVPVQDIPTAATAWSPPSPAVSEARDEVRVRATSLTSFADAIEEAFRKIPPDGPEGYTAAQVKRQWISRGGFVGITQYHVELLHLPFKDRR